MALLIAASIPTAAYQVGVATGDITGPVQDVNFMGMANPKQKGTGLWQRLRARAFVFEEDDQRVALVNLDAGMAGDIVKRRVVAAVAARLGSDAYTMDNVLLTGTHTHSGPSGFLQHTIFQLAGSGWVPQTIDAMVNGTAEAIVRAHAARQPATVSLGVDVVHNASINRSPSAYLLNPADERARYAGDTDDEMVQLSIRAASGEAAGGGGGGGGGVAGAAGAPIGVLNWHAVHGTSLNNTNALVSGDNKGYASWLLEARHNGATSDASRPWDGARFVGAFASSNLGDVSPNILGPRCRDTGLPCDAVHSTCGGKAEMCSAVGPGVDAAGRADMFASTRLIGARQYAVAASLLAQSASASASTTAAAAAAGAAGAAGAAAGAASGAGGGGGGSSRQQPVLSGGVRYAHAYVRMPGRNATDAATGATVGPLCKAALGDSFAAGTIDGPGMFDFTQVVPPLCWPTLTGVLPLTRPCDEPFRGTNSTSWLWRTIAHLAHHASPEEVACQHPKGILLATGSIDFPYPWSTDTVPVQLVQLGAQLVVAAVPTEMTTMAGRRTREALAARLKANGVLDPDNGRVVIAGLSNDYADYTVTREEYQQQRYEAGSTIFGPHQLNGYIDVLLRLADDLAANRAPSWGDAAPPDFSSKLPNPLVTAPQVEVEEPPSGKRFGDVLTQPAPISMSRSTGCGRGGGGGEMAAATATAEFVGGNLRNDLRLGSSYVRVERLVSSSSSSSSSSWAAAVEDPVATAPEEEEKEAWSLVADDGDAATVITSTKERRHQRIAVRWTPSTGTPPGTYRIVHDGAAYVREHLWSRAAVVPYRGVSAPFALSAAPAPKVAVA